MEHAQNVVVAEGDFQWDDLGSWTAMARHIKPDPEGNCAVADFIHVDAARNVVYDARVKNRTPIAIVGSGIYVGLAASAVLVAFGLTIVVRRAATPYVVPSPDDDVE